MKQQLAITTSQDNIDLANLLKQARAFEYKTFDIKQFDENSIEQLIQFAVS